MKQSVAVVGRPNVGKSTFFNKLIGERRSIVQDTPGVFYDLGCGVGTALHTDTFQINEACLLPGIAMQCETALAIMKEVTHS